MEQRTAIAGAHLASKANMQMSNRQQIDSLGTAYFLQEDEKVLQVIMTYCPELVPAFSRLNATSKIEKPKDRRMMELHLEDLLLHAEMQMGDEGDIEDRNLLRSLRIYGKYRIMDALGGYRGKLVTEEIEKVHHSFEEPKKKGFF